MGGGPKTGSRLGATAAIVAVASLWAGSAQAEDDWLRDIRVQEGTGIIAHLHVPFTRFTEKEKPKVGLAVSGPQFIGTRGDLTKFTWDDSVLLNLDMSTSGIEGVNVGGIGATALKDGPPSITGKEKPPVLQGFTIGRGLEVKPWYGLGLQDEAPPPSPRASFGE